MIQRGYVYYIDVDDKKVCGSEQRGRRPGIIVSNNVANMVSPVLSVVFLTSKPKKALPIHVRISSVLDIKQSTALCEQLCTVSRERVGKCLGKVSQREMLQVERSLCIQLGLGRYISLEILRVIRDRRVIRSMVDAMNRLFNLDAEEDQVDEAG